MWSACDSEGMLPCVSAWVYVCVGFHVGVGHVPYLSFHIGYQILKRNGVRYRGGWLFSFLLVLSRVGARPKVILNE